MTPAVSVVVATYNYGRFLAGALRSVLGQTFSDFELVVIDDGSTDDTPEVVRPFLRDGRIRYHRTDHVGQPAAKNAGIRLTNAPLVAFLDADDEWLPRKLETQLALFERDPLLGVAFSRRLLIDEQGRELEYEQPPLPRGNVLREMFQSNFICFSSAMVRRAVFDVAGVFDEQIQLAIDYDLWLRVASLYRFDYADEPLVRYRTGHASLSTRVEERLRTVYRIMQRFLDERGGRAVLDPHVVRQAEAETCYHIALARRNRSRWGALPWYLRALVRSPGYGLAWQGLGSLLLTEEMRRSIRKALGRPEDWSVRRPRQKTAA